MANEARKPSVSDGTRLLPMIQKPSRPMPRSASTACKVVTKTLTLFPFYMRQSALTSSMTAFAVFFFPHTALRQKPAALPQTLRKPPTIGRIVGIQEAIAGSLPMSLQLQEQGRGGPERQSGLFQRSLHFLELFLSNLASGKAKLQDLKRVLWRSRRSLLTGCDRGCGGATHSPEILLNYPGNVSCLTFWEVVQD